MWMIKACWFHIMHITEKFSVALQYVFSVKLKIRVFKLLTRFKIKITTPTCTSLEAAQRPAIANPKSPN